MYVPGHGKLWVPRVPTHFCIKSPTECVCVCGGCVYYGYHGYQHVFVLNLYISAVLARVPMGTKSQGAHNTKNHCVTLTTYTQHTKPLCNTIGKQLSSPVLLGFPYMTFHTKPLRGQTEPLRTLNTQNHCVTLMENNSRGPMLIRVSHI